MSSSTCSVVDDYALMFNGALYIRKVNKSATPEEKKHRRALYMKRYRSGRKGVKDTKKRKYEDGQQGDGEKIVGDGAQQQQKEGAQQQQEDVIARVE